MIAATLALTVALLVPIGATASRPTLETVPEPGIDRLDEADRAQAEAQRQALDHTLERALADETVDDADLARAFGAVGATYLLYDFRDAAAAAFRNARALDSGAFEWAYYLGVVTTYLGDFAVAESSLRDAARLREADLAVWIRLGRVRTDRGDAEGARDAFQTALALDPSSAAAEHGLGLLALEAGDAEDAIARFERALAGQPTATVIHHGLGMAWRRQGDLDRARHHLKANRHTPVRFPDPLIDGLQASLRAPRELVRAGTRAQAAGDLRTARALFEKAVAEDPDDALARYNLARALLETGDVAAAMTEFEAVIARDPDYRDAHVNLALLLADDGRIAEAEPHFRRAAELDPLDLESRHGWAVALARLGQRDRARAVLEALLTAPTLARALQSTVHADLGRLSLAAGDADAAIQQVVSALRAAPEGAPSTLELRGTLAQLEGRAGRFDDAARHLQAIVARQPENADARFGAAMSLLLADQPAEARAVLEAGGRENGRPLPIQHMLARVLATADDAAVRDGARALVLAREVLSATGDPEHAQTVAMALAETGDWTAAVALQTQVLDQVRQSATAQPGRGDLARIEQRLERYRARQPVRAPWAARANR